MDVKTPVSFSQYHKRFTFRDADGRDLFELSVIRPSIEAWQDLADFGNLVCDLLNDHSAKLEYLNKLKEKREARQDKVDEEAVNQAI